MALSFNLGTGATGTPVNFAVAPWDYDDAIRVTSEAPTLVKMNDILSPIDLPTEVKISVEKIANVYTTLGGGRIPVAEQSSNTSGVTIFVEVKTVGTYDRSATDPTLGRIQVPMVGRLEFRLPNDVNIGSTAEATLLSTVIASICDSAGALRLDEIRRGALVPKEI